MVTGEKEGEGQGEGGGSDRGSGKSFPFLPSFLPNVDNLRAKESKFSSLSDDDEKKGTCARAGADKVLRTPFSHIPPASIACSLN